MMKKLYSFLGAALIALGFASTSEAKVAPVDINNIPAKGQQILNTEIARIKLNHELGIQNPNATTRTFTDVNGTVWDLTLQNIGYAWVDLLWEPGTLSFNEFPYYVVMYTLMNEDASTYVVLPMFWPAMCAAEQPNIEGESYPEGSNFDIAPIEYVANESSIKQFKNCWYISDQSYYPGPVPVKGADGNPTNEFEAWGIYPWPASFGATCTFNKTEVTPLFTSLANRQNTVAFESFNAETNDCKVTNLIYLSRLTDGNPSGSADFTIRQTPYEGTIGDKGFRTHSYEINMTDLHVFNCGELSSENCSDYFDRDFSDWGPVQKLLLMSCGGDLKTAWATNAPEIKSEYIGYDFEGEKVAPEKFSYWKGAAFVKAGEPIPAKDAKYVVAPIDVEYDPDMDVEVIWNVPEENTMLPYYNEIGYTIPDGATIGIYKQEVYTARSIDTEFNTETNSCVAMFTPEGCIFILNDPYGDRVKFVFDGEVVVHPNQKDINEVVTMSAKGENEARVEEIAENEFIGVLNGNVIAPAGAVVYDLSGRRVNNENLNKGLYIIRAGNKAVKVLVK